MRYKGKEAGTGAVSDQGRTLSQCEVGARRRQALTRDLSLVSSTKARQSRH